MSLEINESNFTMYFRDVRTSGPEPDDVMARFRAMADLVESDDKEIVIDLLSTNKMGGEMAVKVLRNRCDVADEDSVRLAREMCEDLLSGKTKAEVMEKPHHFLMQKFFYTKKEYVPDDPHWDVLKLIQAKQISEV